MIELWDVAFFKPMLNSLIVLSNFLLHDFGLTIIVFTLIVRAIITPLTLRQLRATRAMSTIQPKLQELQKKYARDKEKLSRETMKLYKEHGMNPLGCLGPMVVQFPVWIALYQAILKALAATPEELLSLSKYLYSWPMVQDVVPLGEHFLWLNLAQPDPYWILPILVGGTMWLQQKMSSIPGPDPRQQSMNSMMLWMMPMMFALFTLQFASGLAVFWVMSNIVGIVTQYFVTGWGGLKPSPVMTPSVPEKRTDYGEPRVQREDSGRGHQAGPGKAGPEARGGRDNRPKKG